MSLTVHIRPSTTVLPFRAGTSTGPLDRLRRNPVARLAEGFARVVQKPPLIETLQIIGQPGVLGPQILPRERQVLCPVDARPQDLVPVLHRHFCNAHLSGLRDTLGPFGRDVLENIIDVATQTWKNLSDNYPAKIIPTDDIRTIWHDQRRKAYLTIEPSLAVNGISYLPDLMFSQFQTRLFGNESGWDALGLVHGGPDQKEDRLRDAKVIIRHALPIVTHIPGLRMSFLKGDIVPKVLIAKATYLSLSDHQAGSTPRPQTARRRAALKLVPPCS